jgi:hypothetical protein
MPDKKSKVVKVTEPSLEEFFANVSQSLIQAQKELNKNSIEYVKSLSDLDQPIPPAYFAIPNVKAEMKLGFKSLEGKKVNIILFSKTDEKQQYGESTVSFELVSAPPPPGRLAPIPSFIVLGKQRDEIIQVLVDQISRINKLDAYQNTKNEALVIKYDENQEYVVIWSARARASKKDTWFEISFFNLTKTEESYEINTKIFKTKTKLEQGLFLKIPNKTTIKNITDLETLRETLTNTGDVISKLVLSVDEWISASGTKENTKE